MKKRSRRADKNKSSKLQITLLIVTLILASITIFLYVRPIQIPTGRYEIQVACPICPAFARVEVMKPDYTYAHLSAGLAVIFASGLVYVMHRNRS